MVRRLLCFFAFGFGIVVSGCPSAAPLGWEIEVQDGDLLARTVVIEATIHEGGCTGDTLYAAELRRVGDEAPMPPVLPDGLYGFAADARDSSCLIIAEGCTELELPAIGPVVTIAEAPVTERPACGPSRCRDGSCGTGGGPGVDGGPRPDSGPGEDGGGEDSGCVMSSESICTDGVDDDCDGDTDCADSECVTSPSCVLCGAAPCPTCQTCVSEACVLAGDTTPCPSGTCRMGTCCTGCVDGVGACQAGTDPTMCGAGGATCEACGPCETCGPAGCAAAMMGTICDDVGTPGRCGGSPILCCTGCLQAGTCHPGNEDARCGTGGGTCRDCAGMGMTCGAGGCT